MIKAAICFIAAPAESTLLLPKPAHFLACIHQPRQSDKSFTTLPRGGWDTGYSAPVGLDKDTVNRVILRAGEHCANCTFQTVDFIKTDQGTA